MVDDSKHTEDGDMSRLEYADHHFQDTNRNLKRTSEIDISTEQTIDLRKNNLNNDTSPESMNKDKRSNSRNRIKQQRSQIGTAYTQDEEQKTHDLMNQDLDDNDTDEVKQKQKVNRVFNTDGNLDDNEEDFISSTQKPKIGSFSLKAHLPQIKINIPLSISGNDVFEIFTNICKTQSFQVIEMDQNIATAVNKEPFSFKKIFQRCIPFSDFKKDQPNESMISAVRLSINVNEIKSCRKVSLKGLYGETLRLQEFLTIFKNKLHELVKLLSNDKKNHKTHISEGTPNNRQVKPSIQYNNKRKGMRIDSDEDSDSEQNNGAFNETSAIYQIHKILSSDQYTLGKNVAQYIECFHLQYKSLRESAQLLPQPMEGVMALIQETVHSFQSEYNLGKETAKGLMTFCRPSVEKYVYSKVYDKLFAMYAIKNEEEDKLFNERGSQVKRIKAHDIMKYLDIKDSFIIGENTAHSMKFEDHIKDLHNNSHYDSHRSENFNLVNSEHQFNQTSTSSNMGSHSLLTKNELPYSEAIKCLDKIQQLQSPREKLQCLSESFGCLKTTIVSHWKGKLELNTMDDVLPLTIYVVAMSDLSHPASELNIMEDYLSLYDKGFDFERKLLTNFDVSIRYTNHEWDLQSN